MPTKHDKRKRRREACEHAAAMWSFLEADDVTTLAKARQHFDAIAEVMGWKPRPLKVIPFIEDVGGNDEPWPDEEAA